MQEQFRLIVFSTLSIQVGLLLVAAFHSIRHWREAAAVYLVAGFVGVLAVSSGVLYEIEVADPSTDLIANLLMMLRPLPVLCLFLFTDASLFPRKSRPYHRLPNILWLYAIYCSIFVLIYLLPLAKPLAITLAVAISTLVKLLVIVRILALIFRYNAVAKEQYSKIRKRSYYWIEIVCLLSAARTVTLSLAIVLEDHRIGSVSDAILLTAISFTTLIAHLSSSFFTPIMDLSQGPTTNGKGASTTLSAEELATLAAKITTALGDNKLYRQHDLNLRELADAIETKPYLVTLAINQCLKANFYDLINRYRIEEASTLLVEQPRARIFDIAVDVGYSTKSAFNAAFKRRTGTSPSAFRLRNDF